MTTYVYMHHRADNGLPFYVGIGNYYRAGNRASRSAQWRAIDLAHGRIVNRVGSFERREDACAMEVMLIAEWSEAGVALVNKTTGGEATYSYPPELCAQMSASLQAACKRASTIAKKKATMATPRYRENMSKAVREAQAKPEVQEKIKAWLASDEFKWWAVAKRARPVMRSDGALYLSANHAARATGVTDAAIHSVLAHKTFTAGGFGWMRVGDERGFPVKPPFTRNQVRVIRSDGVDFASIGAAEQAHGLKAGAIRYALRTGGRTAGFQWAYADAKGGTVGVTKPVIRGDGTTYASCTEAARACGISQSMLGRALAGKAPTAGGFTWRFAD